MSLCTLPLFAPKRPNGTELSRRRNARRYLAGETPCKAYATAGRTQLPARVLHPETRYKRRTLQNAARSAVGCSEWLGRPMSWMTSPGVEPERYLGRPTFAGDVAP